MSICLRERDRLRYNNYELVSTTEHEWVKPLADHITSATGLAVTTETLQALDNTPRFSIKNNLLPMLQRELPSVTIKGTDEDDFDDEFIGYVHFRMAVGARSFRIAFSIYPTDNAVLNLISDHPCELGTLSRLLDRIDIPAEKIYYPYNVFPTFEPLSGYVLQTILKDLESLQPALDMVIGL